MTSREGELAPGYVFKDGYILIEYVMETGFRYRGFKIVRYSGAFGENNKRINGSKGN